MNSTSAVQAAVKQVLRVASYTRISDPSQRIESLCDQQRRIEDLANRMGLTVDPTLAFSDTAISGKQEATFKRVGYQALLAAWDRREFDVLIVDEVSRLGRGRVELARMQERIAKSGVRVFTCDGLDSTQPTWGLTFAVASVLAAHELEELRFRVVRGMQGALIRGRQIGYPGYGYVLERLVKPDGTPDGSVWRIDPETAPIVKEIYRMRAEQGMSLIQIAAELNRRGIRTSTIRKKGGKFWRPASVRAILRNTIYRGLFVLNGSPFTQAKARREGAVVKTTEFERPELRLVPDELWHAANPVGNGWVRRGSRSALSSLVTCSACGNCLTVSHQGARESLYCASCAQAARVGAMPNYAGNVTGGVVEAALKAVFEGILVSDETMSRVRDGLRARLNEGIEGEISILENRLRLANRATTRYRSMLEYVPPEEEANTKAAYVDAAREAADLQRKLAKLRDRAEQQDAEAIAAQLEADPTVLKASLFTTSLPPGQLRSLLGRIFPQVTFCGKICRYGGLFEIEVAPGVAMAEVSKTPLLDDGTIAVRVQVERVGELPTRWQSTIVDRLPAATWRVGDYQDEEGH